MTDKRRVLMIASFPHMRDKVVDGVEAKTLSFVSSHPAQGCDGTEIKP